MGDLRRALRGLAEQPLFAAVAILMLALGIGANTAIFSAMNAVVQRALPVRDPQRVVLLRITPGQPDGASDTGRGDNSFSEYVFEQLRAEHRAFSDVMAYVPLGFNKIAVRTGSRIEEASGEMVSGNYFGGLGVRPECGRMLSRADERDHAPVVVLSYGYWNRSFGHDCRVVGEVISIKGAPFTVAGVANARFIGLGGDPTDLWIPLQTRQDFNAWGSQGENYYAAPNWWCIMLAGRLTTGVSKKQAEAIANPVFVRAAYEHLGGKPRTGEKPPRLQVAEARGLSGYRNAYAQPLTMLLAMVGTVLIIACGNVSMLLAARNTARRREFSIRLALGGSSGHLFRQLLAEGLVLVAAGALLGWLFAVEATRALAQWSDIQASLSPDGNVLLFTLAISLVAALVFGLTPLWRVAKISVAEVLKTSGATAFRDKATVQLGRVTATLQVALCLVLLAGTMLLVRTLRNLETVDLGFRSGGLLVFGVNPRVDAHSDEKTIAFYRSLLEKLRSLPAVETVTVMQNRIGSGWSNNTSAILDGKHPHPGQDSPMRWNGIGADYFRTLGIPLLSGREFDNGDGPKSAKVAVVNSTFVKNYLGGQPALGHSISFSSKTGPFTIVGIVPDSKYTQVREEPAPMAYFPYTQLEGLGAMHVEMRTHGDPKLLIPGVQRVMVGFAPDLTPLQPMAQIDQFRASIAGDRLIARLAMCFGLLAVALVATGLYGTVAYNVNRRTSELGIRMALGAERPQVLWMVLKEGMYLSLIGIVVGLPLTFAAARSLGSLLYGLKPYDPLSIAAAAVGITAVTALACLVPAQRAAGINPALALRNE